MRSEWIARHVADGAESPNRSRRARADVPRMGARLPFPHRTDRARAPRLPDAPRTAFVLSGGGNQGVSQVGMLRALLERGIVPDVVIGTSAGALNGAAICYAPNLTGVAQLAAVWEQLRADHVFPGGKIQPGLERRAPRDAPLRKRRASTRSSTTATPARSFADLEIPLRVIATDLDTGEEVVLARGPLKPALLASAALPGRVPDRRTTTAAGSSTAASSTAFRCGTRSPGRSTGCSCSTSRPARPTAIERSPLDVVMTSFMHARSQRFELELRYVPPESRGRRAPPAARPARPVRLLGRAGADRRGVRARRRRSSIGSPRPTSRRTATAPAPPALPAAPSTTESVAG